jgi:hypothetical protein
MFLDDENDNCVFLSFYEQFFVFSERKFVIFFKYERERDFKTQHHFILGTIGCRRDFFFFFFFGGGGVYYFLFIIIIIIITRVKIRKANLTKNNFKKKYQKIFREFFFQFFLGLLLITICIFWWFLVVNCIFFVVFFLQLKVIFPFF